MDVEKVIEELEEARKCGNDNTPFMNEILDNAIQTIRELQEQNKALINGECIVDGEVDYCDMNKQCRYVRELQSQIPKWHLVADEDLPSEPTTYLCAVRHRFNRTDRWRWTTTELRLFGTVSQWIVNENTEEVIAWMELPKFESEE